MSLTLEKKIRRVLCRFSHFTWFFFCNFQIHERYFSIFKLKNNFLLKKLLVRAHYAPTHG